MAQLIFLPWYCIVDPTVIGRYKFTSFDTSSAPTNQLEQDAKVILKSYLLSPFTSAQTTPPLKEKPVKKTTLIEITSGTLDVDEIEVLQYVVSFAGISDREFVDSHLYLCSENLRILVQSYQTPLANSFDPLIGTKTKEGTSYKTFSANLFREVKPWYISHQSIPGNISYRLKFNANLGHALWSFYLSTGPKESLWVNNIFPSLFSYHQANTDGHSDQMECIYSQAAIEKLFLGNGHKENALVDAVLQFLQNKQIVFEPLTTANRNWQSITYKVNSQNVPSNSIFEAWLRELVRLRNKFAHGGHQAAGNWQWTVSEHLLLSSFIYPLLLKLFISQYDSTISFTISSDDLKKIRMLEVILDSQNYFSELSPGVTCWGDLISQSRYLV